MKPKLLKRASALLLVLVMITSHTTFVPADEIPVSSAGGAFSTDEFYAMMAGQVYMSEDEFKIFMGDDGLIYKVGKGAGTKLSFPYEPEKYTYDPATGLCTSDLDMVFAIEDGVITKIYYTDSPDYVYEAYDRLTPEELTARLADKYEGSYGGKTYALTKTADSLILSNGSSTETLDLYSWVIFETDSFLAMDSCSYDDGYTVKFPLTDGIVKEIYKETYWETEWAVFADSTGSGGSDEPTAEASGQCGDQAYWALANGTLTISGTGDMYDMTDNDAVSIAGKAPWNDYRSEIKKVVIENGITGIGRYAFFKCTALTEVEIPDSVTFIGRHAFHGCSSLPSITIPGSVSDIEDTTFAGCTSLKTAIIEEGVTTLGVGMFSGNNLLVNVSLPGTLTGIASSAFYSCKGLKQIDIPDTVSAIHGGAFEYCSSLESAVIPEGVTEIESVSFGYCTSLKSLTIPSTVTTFNSYALDGCTALESLAIPEGTTKIYDYAFRNCKSIKEITIPSSVTYLGECAFRDCTSLETVKIEDGICKIGKNAFVNCTKVTDVYVHGTDYKDYLFDSEAAVDDFNKPSGTTIHIPASVDLASLTPESDGAIYYWCSANPACVVNDIPDAASAPAFATHSLTLSGEIGVNFYMDLPAISGVDYSESFMTFNVSGLNGETTTVPYDPARMNPSGTYYGFTCYINALQMADTISAEFHYFENEVENVITETYTAEDYITSIYGTGSEELSALIKNLYIYGYRAQQFLSVQNNWVIGEDHEAMEKIDVDDYSTEDYNEARSAVADMAPSVSKNADIDRISFSLVLDSETAIALYIKPMSGYSGSFSAKVDGVSVESEKLADGRYKVVIPNIGAHKLGRVYTAELETASGLSTISLSALSYVRACFESGSTDENMLGLMTALYYYNKAAMDYIG